MVTSLFERLLIVTIVATQIPAQAMLPGEKPFFTPPRGTASSAGTHSIPGQARAPSSGAHSTPPMAQSRPINPTGYASTPPRVEEPWNVVQQLAQSLPGTSAIMRLILLQRNSDQSNGGDSLPSPPAPGQKFIFTFPGSNLAMAISFQTMNMPSQILLNPPLLHPYQAPQPTMTGSQPFVGEAQGSENPLTHETPLLLAPEPTLLPSELPQDFLGDNPSEDYTLTKEDLEGLEALLNPQPPQASLPVSRQMDPFSLRNPGNSHYTVPFTPQTGPFSLRNPRNSHETVPFSPQYASSSGANFGQTQFSATFSPPQMPLSHPQHSHPLHTSLTHPSLLPNAQPTPPAFYVGPNRVYPQFSEAFTPPRMPSPCAQKFSFSQPSRLTLMHPSSSTPSYAAPSAPHAEGTPTGLPDLMYTHLTHQPHPPVIVIEPDTAPEPDEENGTPCKRQRTEKKAHRDTETPGNGGFSADENPSKNHEAPTMLARKSD